MRIARWCLVLSFLMFPLAALADDGGQAGADEEIEEIEEVEVVEATPAGSPPKLAEPTFLENVGRMHSAFVHLPIAWLVLLLLVDLLGLGLGKELFAKVGLPLAVLTVLSFMPAALTGMLNYSHKPENWSAEELAALHRNLMIAGAFVLTLATALRFALRKRFAGAPKWSYLALVAISLALVSISGHLGGKLVFGDSYLPF